MKLSYSILLAALSISSLIVPQKVQANLFRININETGGDVVFSFDGSIDLTGATTGIAVAVRQTFMAGGSGALDDSNRSIQMGGQNGDNDSIGRRYDFGTGGPLPVFGTNNNTYGAKPEYGSYTVTGSGDPFDIRGNFVTLPLTYNSGDNITGQMTFENTTFSTFGINTGTYSYLLGSNNMEIVANTAAVPGPLPILGVPVVFYYFKKLKEKTRHQRGAKLAPIGASNS